MRRSEARLFAIAGASLLVAPLFCVQALAQSDPTSNVVRQLERRLENFTRETRVDQQGNPIITEPVVQSELPAPGGPTIMLQAVTFEPASQFIDDAELNALAAQYTGRPIDFSEISALVRKINDIYAERGVVTASAILPPQDLSKKVLKIELVEGRLGNLGIVGERRTKDQAILDRVRLVKGDQIVDVPTASRDITFSNRTSLLQIRMLLQPGASFGLTDLALGITEPPRNELSAYLDNQGVNSTGEITGGLIWRHYGALGIDDSFLAYLSASEGSASGTFMYDVPLGATGTRMSLGYAGSGTKVVDGPSKDLDVKGSSHAFTGTLSQALYVDTNWLVQATGSLSYILSDSDLSTFALVDTRTTRTVLSLPISYIGDNYSAYIQPQLIYAHVENRLAEDSPASDYLLFAGGFGGTFGFTENISGNIRGGWQYTSEKLLPGNLLFNIGGPTTIRGYPSDGIAGDSGYYVQTELGYRFEGAFEGLYSFGFIDSGEVFSTFPARTTLVSAGLGMSYQFNDNATLELSAGVPLRKSMANQSDVTFLGRITAKLN